MAFLSGSIFSDLQRRRSEHFLGQKETLALQLPFGVSRIPGKTTFGNYMQEDETVIDTKEKPIDSCDSHDMWTPTRAHSQSDSHSKSPAVYSKKKCKTAPKSWGLQNELLDIQNSHGSIISRSATDLSALRDSLSSMDVTGRSISMSSLQLQLQR